MGMSYDVNGKRIITKGTRVRVRTTNGGELIGPLFSNHYPTYDVELESEGKRFVLIPSYRVETVSIVDDNL